MLSLPIKLTRAQTRFLKKSDLVCVGKGSFDTPLFGGIRLECHYVNLGAEKVSFIADEKRGNCDTYLYFLPRAEFQRLGLTERKDLIVPHVAKSRAAKVKPAKPAYRYAYNPRGNHIERFNPNFYQVIRPSGFERVHKRSYLLSAIESSILHGNLNELTHSQFVAKINSWGWNEDGTKIVPPAPPKPEPAPAPKFGRDNIGQVWMIDYLPCMICQTASDVFRAIGVEQGMTEDLGNRFSDNDKIPAGSRMIAPTLVDYFKNKLES